ncbi:MAG: hypothetical protein V4667_06230 [Bacteroidota bacterium]
MYPFTIRGDKINSQDEFCEYFKKAAHWGPMHRKNESYIDDIFDEIDTWKDKDAYNFLMDEASLVGAKLLATETDSQVIFFIRHFVGGKAGLVYNAACQRIINDASFFDSTLEKYAAENIKELAQNCDDKELKNKLKEKLEQKGDLVTLFKSYMDEHNEKMIDLFYSLAEQKRIEGSVVSRFAIILYSRFESRVNEVLHKVQICDISIKRPFFEQVRECFAIRINASKTKIFGQEIVDFDRDVQTYKYNPSSASPIKNNSYPFVFARGEVTNFNYFSNHFQYVAETLNRDNIENTVNYINRICKANSFITTELNKAIENVFLNSTSVESIVFSCELALVLGNENTYIAAIQRATKEGTNFYCYTFQYNLFLKLIELGFKVNDTSQREMLIQFLLFNKEPKLVLKYCVESNDARLLSIFKTAVKQCYIGDDLARQIAETIVKNNPDKIFEACDMAKYFFMDSYKNEFKKVFSNHLPQNISDIESRIFKK